VSRQTLVVYWADGANRTLSYQHGWPVALAADRDLDVVTVNLASRLERERLAFRRARGLGAVVLLHSVFSNDRNLNGRAFEAVARLDAPKVYFIGNEYKLMPEKMAFAEALGLDLLVTQIASPEVATLYRERLGCEVQYMPNTGIDPSVFESSALRRDRPVEIGYRGFDAPFYLGHDERRRLPQAFASSARRLDLTVDISLDERARFDTAGWAAFLNRCRGTIGCEAGSDYFELDDHSRLAVNALVAHRPGITFDEVFEQVFTTYEHPVSGRTISGRVVEAAAAGTTQLLIEGDYAGHFEPDLHYIPLRKDLSNIDEAVGRFRDVAEADRIAAAARGRALEQFTWPQLVAQLRTALARVAG
jgi:hypothetical protein